MKVLYADTVGFISDIPTSLIASFAATLEDAVLADVLIHVRDVSHPDTISQNKNVLATLKSLKMPQGLLDNMITVGNKIDKVAPMEWQELKKGEYVPISATKG